MILVLERLILPGRRTPARSAPVLKRLWITSIVAKEPTSCFNTYSWLMIAEIVLLSLYSTFVGSLLKRRNTAKLQIVYLR